MGVRAAVRGPQLSTTIAVLVAALALTPGAAPGEGPAYLVKDLADGTDPEVSSNPGGFVDLGNLVLFAAGDDAHGRELWRTDGRPGGTALLVDLAPGSADGIRFNGARVILDGVLYFAASDGIWRSDGTAAGTRRIAEITAGHLATDGEALYAFAGGLRDAWNALWRIAPDDGTATLLREFAFAVASPRNVLPSPVALDGRLYFAAADVVAGEGLWSSDGTAAGTRMVRRVQVANREGGNDDTHLIAVGAQVFFAARDEAGWELWRSDGTAAGTVRVRDIHSGAANGIHFNDYTETVEPYFAALGDTLLFMARDAATGLELWRSDGTEAGTQPVADVAAGALGLDGTLSDDDRSDVALGTIRMLPAGGRVFFTARPAGTTLELWETDGTAAGTRAVTALTDDWGRVQDAVVRDEGGGAIWLHLSVHSWREGVRLWTSDGTGSGTQSIPVPYRDASELTATADGLIFAADDGEAGWELWTSDGTAAGTRRLADLARGRPGLDPQALADFGGTLVFSGRALPYGRELWRSDGTSDGTVLIADVAPGARSSEPRSLTPSGETLYFSAGDGVHGRELWRSDGTAAGTYLVADIAAGADASDPDELVADGHGGIYFFASQPGTGYELWHSDGTAAGTRLVRDIHPGENGSRSYGDLPMLLFGEALLFAAREPEYGDELWRSDGTADGTRVLADLRAISYRDGPDGLTAVGELVVFFADDDSGEESLWRTDGSAAGTARLAGVGRLMGRPAVVNGRMLFVTLTFAASRARYQLWQTDGTPQGTFVIDDRAVNVPQVAAAGDSLFALLPVADVELRRAGCGTLLESPDALTDLYGLDDRLLVTEPTHRGALRLWTSDGTAAGTFALQELPGLPDDGRLRDPAVSDFTRAGEHVFFAGEHGEAGRELWALPVSALPVVEASPCAPLPTPTPRPTSSPFDCPAGERCTVLELSGATARPGDAVVVAATLRASDGPIAGVQNDLTFPDGMVVPARADGRPDCQVEPGIGKDETGFTYQPPGCTPGEDCTGLRAIVISFTNVDPIADASLLYTCTLVVGPDVPAGEYPLHLSELFASDPEGTEVALDGIDGLVVVRQPSGTRGVVAGGGHQGCQTAAPQESALPLAGMALALAAVRLLRTPRFGGAR